MEAPDLTNLFPGLSPEQTENVVKAEHMGRLRKYGDNNGYAFIDCPYLKQMGYERDIYIHGRVLPHPNPQIGVAIAFQVRVTPKGQIQAATSRLVPEAEATMVPSAPKQDLSQPSPDKIYEGTLKSGNPGYRFIACEEARLHYQGRDVFLHRNQLCQPFIDGLRITFQVQFSSEGKPAAKNVNVSEDQTADIARQLENQPPVERDFGFKGGRDRRRYEDHRDRGYGRDRERDYQRERDGREWDGGRDHRDDIREEPTYHAHDKDERGWSEREHADPREREHDRDNRDIERTRTLARTRDSDPAGPMADQVTQLQHMCQSAKLPDSLINFPDIDRIMKELTGPADTSLPFNNLSSRGISGPQLSNVTTAAALSGLSGGIDSAGIITLRLSDLKKAE